MTKCQLMLLHPVMSLVPTLDCIEIAQRRHPDDRTLDHLTLKMTNRNILTYGLQIFIYTSLVGQMGS